MPEGQLHCGPSVYICRGFEVIYILKSWQLRKLIRITKTIRKTSIIKYPPNTEGGELKATHIQQMAKTNLKHKYSQPRYYIRGLCYYSAHLSYASTSSIQVSLIHGNFFKIRSIYDYIHNKTVMAWWHTIVHSACVKNSTLCGFLIIFNVFQFIWFHIWDYYFHNSSLRSELLYNRFQIMYEYILILNTLLNNLTWNVNMPAIPKRLRMVRISCFDENFILW